MKRNTKKALALLSCLAITFNMLTGCGSKEQTAQSSEAATTVAAETSAAAVSTVPAENVKLSFLIDNQTTLDGLKAMSSEVEKLYNITTEFELRPGGTEGDNIVKTRLATGDMNDLCAYNSGSLLAALNPSQYFEDLSNEPFMAKTVDSFKACVTVDGKIYGVPFGSFMGGGWYYNKKIYAELGLSVPKTWDDLLANCEKIKAAGKTAVIGSYKDSWTSQLVILADYFNLSTAVPNFATEYTANKAKYANTPAALNGFEKLQQISEKAYMNKDYLATTFDAALKLLAEGSGAHYPMLTMATPTLAKNFPDNVDDIGFFAQPGSSADKNGLTVWACGSVYISKGEKVEAAKKWANYIASTEACAAYAAVQMPDGPFAIIGAVLPDNVEGATKDMLPYFDANKTIPALEYLSPIKGPNLPQICVQAGSGIKPALDCAKEYDKDVEKQAKQLKLAGW